jgi:hypothetical protein
LLSIGCSSESTNTGSGGSTGTGGAAGGGGGISVPESCVTTCKAIDSTGCPGEDFDECKVVCAASTQTCPTVTSDFGTCVAQNSAGFTCDGDGEVAFNNCEATFIKLLPCTACIPRPSDTTGTKCTKEQCCGELKEAYSRADILQFLACISACPGGDLCPDCATQYPETAQKFQALYGCVGVKCGG